MGSIFLLHYDVEGYPQVYALATVNSGYRAHDVLKTLRTVLVRRERDRKPLLTVVVGLVQDDDVAFRSRQVFDTGLDQRLSP